MARTIIDVELEIAQCNSALQDMTLGKRRTELIIGSGEYQNRYKFQEISPEWIEARLIKLQAELIALTPTAQVSFRSTSTMSIIVPKYGNSGFGDF